MLFSTPAFCQSLGDPIVNITFGTGSGKFGGRLPPASGTTTYTYYDDASFPGQGFPQDGQYTITNTSAGINQVWVSTSDHTGDPGGYYMLVNAANTPGIFYTRNVTELCAGTKYQFGAFIKNIFSNNGGNPPNVKFQIETDAGVIQYDTGNIPADNTWHAYTMEFTTPANAGTIVLKMINNGPGGYGNDLAIDDITFRPYGAPVQVAFDQSSSTQICAGVPQTVKIVSATAASQGYSQKVQQKVNGVWTDIVATVNGTQYSFAAPLVAGTYNYRLISGLSANIDNSNCVVASNELVLTVLPQPIPAFTAPADACPGNPVSFRDNSVSNGAAVSSWLWNFGDGQSSNLQHPVHSYNAAGDYTVSLRVANGNGCSSVTITQPIHINALPVAAFTISNPACANRPIVITDASTAPSGTTVQSRVWEIEGVTLNKADGQPFVHTFAAAGTYAVKLTVTSSTGCPSTTTQQIVVKPLPVIDFDTPPTCISDNTIFTNRTTIADNSALTYLWNFGDNTPVSTAKDPVHKYQSTGNYTITLTVSTASGCSETKSKPFTVNGATPVADFEVLNKNSLCSNNEVVIQNKSTVVEFGNVTRIDLYYDYGNTPTLVETDNNPTPGKMYGHTYPQTHAGNKTYKVRMLAYSGSVCISQEKTENINILATPLVVFTQPAAICANNGPIQLNGHDESGSGIPGSGIYTGTGVSQAGLFDPAVSGPGKFVIQYTYTFSTTGCSNTISREVTVDPVPTVEVPGNITILEGGSRVITANATGNGLRYAWLPVTGLSDATIASPTVTGIADITYRVTVTNDKGCQQFADMVVTVLKTPLMPNAFTPNGDGINDIWEIKYLDSYPGCTVNVFNRYGQKVFSSIGYSTPWDGRANNGNLTPGVYYYIIDPKNGRKAMSGAVTIIR
ncbi:PKD domain-containing protein [Mucilaginibacter calamicampi]|uniref:PKD domain-containing protein n=1 Tax=Mucilaginibacter calamicampi TaxID=1302352 RepID=UPI0036711807